MDGQMAKVFQRRHGVASADELHQAGCTVAQIRAALVRGEVEAMCRGVFGAVAAPRTREFDLRAALLSVAGGVLAERPAGRLWGWRRLGPGPTDLVVGHDGSATRTLARIRRLQRLDPRDVVAREDGLVLTSPALTLFTLARSLSDDALASVLEQALHEQQVTFADLDRIIARYCKRGSDGAARFRRIVDQRNPDVAPNESDGEVVLDRALRAAGVHLTPQYWLDLPSGRRVRLDLAEPVLRYDLEVDNPVFHGSVPDRRRDHARDRAVTATGWAVRRLRSEMVHRTTAQAVAIVQADLAQLRTSVS